MLKRASKKHTEKICLFFSFGEVGLFNFVEVGVFNLSSYIQLIENILAVVSYMRITTKRPIQ